MIQLLQAHSGTLYLASLVLLSSVLLALCLKSLEAWREVREIQNGPLNSSSNSSIIVSGTSFLPASMINRLAVAAVLSTAFALTVSVWLIFDRFGGDGLVKKTNVQVLWRDGTQFCMRDSAGEFSAHPCPPDFPGDIVGGVTLTRYNFRYDQHLNCNVWANKQDEGYSAWRYSDDRPILTAFARPASSGCANPRAAETETTARARR